VRDRIILIGITLLVWIGLKLVDCFFTSPEVLVVLAVILVGIIFHSLWLFSAQLKWRYNYRRKEEKRRDKDQRPKEVHWEPVVDIFIAAKNEARVIENTVRNMFKIDYDKLFVWVIDDCSTDNTMEILNRLKLEFPNFRAVSRTYGSFPGKSAALNEALPLSKGEVIIVFDADAYVEPAFIRNTVPLLQPEGIGAVQVQKKIYAHQKGFLVMCQSSEYALDTYLQTGRDVIRGACELRGNGELIRRNALVDVGGWNNRAITDDLDLSMKLLINHWDIRFCPTEYVYEEAVTNLQALIRQRRRWAEGAIRRYLDYIFPLNSPTRLSLVERLDTLAFTVFFVVPTLLLCEFSTEVSRLIAGLPIQGGFFVFVAVSAMLISQLNLFIAIRFYRRNASIFEALWQSYAVNAYIYLHWVPCIVISLCQILFGKQTSTWHRTEHVGSSALN
jgi:1,2-diacylglycerol 3-beta-glucosyltransferase